MDKQIIVHIDLENTTHKVGNLWTHRTKSGEGATFKYDDNWLNNPLSFALEPLLSLRKTPHFTKKGYSLFGSINDSAPDRWGRMLLNQNEKNLADDDGRHHRSLSEVDYLLGVTDIARLGALRFAEKEDGPFLAVSKKNSIPPLIRIGELLHAVVELEKDRENIKDLQILLAPGSSLGGARAKASIFDHENKLAMAKFPQANDEWPVIKWEAVALTLAKKAGIEVPIWQLESVHGKNVLILQRFDRDGTKRIPFISAMSMLKSKDNEFHSYLDILYEIKKHGSRPSQDVEELFRRVVFNTLITNTDAHLRNHGFLFDKYGWKLSPAYDMNPEPNKGPRPLHSLAIDNMRKGASLDLVFNTAEQYNLSLGKAKSIAKEVGIAVTQWREVANKIGIKNSEIKDMTSAFEHEDLKLACNPI